MAQATWLPYDPDTRPVIDPEKIAATRDLINSALLRRAFAANIATQGGMDAQGNPVRPGALNEAGFLRAAQAAQLNPQDYQLPNQWAGQQGDAALQQIGQNMAIRQMGGNPQEMTRNGAGFGAPQGHFEKVDTSWMEDPRLKGQAAPAAQDPGVLQKLAEFLGLSQPAAQPAPVQEAAAPPQAAAPPLPPGGAQASDYTQPTAIQDLGAGRITAPSDSPPQDHPMERFVPGGPDNRTGVQAVVDSAGTSSGLPGTSFAGAGGEASDLFTWEPKDDGTNTYRQYRQALGQKLNAAGFPDASTYLRSIYENTIKENVPTVPTPMMALDPKTGRIDQGKFQQLLSEYAAKGIQAEGKARAAVMAARGTLADEANKYGVATVEQRKTELADGTLLRDTGSRDQAAALRTNFGNIDSLQKELNAAGTNTTALGLLAPQIARAYATALNPGAQLSEGNLDEVARALYPEQFGNKDLIKKAVMGLVRGFKNGDWSLFNQISDAVDAGDPKAVAARFGRMLSEAGKRNATTYDSYVTPAPKSTTEQLSDAVGTTPKPTPAPAGAPAKEQARTVSQGSGEQKPEAGRKPPAATGGPKVGEQKTRGGVTAEWDGKTWRRVR